MEVSSLLLLGSKGLRLSLHTWQQAPPLTEPPHGPTYHSAHSETRSGYIAHPWLKLGAAPYLLGP